MSAQLTPESLYERLLKFGINCLRLVKHLPKAIYNTNYGSQLIRSSSSPGANYIEAIEGTSKKDFIYKLKTCRKETKESVHWLRLIAVANEGVQGLNTDCDLLIKEASELIRIFTSSIITSIKNQEIKKN